MKAIVRTRYGPPDILVLREIDIPEPNEKQVLVKVNSASVNPLDWHVLRGKPFFVRLMGFGFPRPKRPGIGTDLAGRVEAVGQNVTRFKPGDEVFGSGTGCFAEYAICPEKYLAPKPANMPFDQAAGVSVAALTALQSLRIRGAIQPGQEVLINGASGGVGTFAVQIARALGAHVTGVCSARNVEMVRSLGAEDVIDYTKEHYWQSGKKYDLIIDTAAYGPFLKLLRALKTTGSFVMVGGGMKNLLKVMMLGPLLSRKRGKRISSMLTDLNEADLTFMKELIESGKVVTVIDREYPLSEVPQAIRYVEEGHSQGKVIISVFGGGV